MKRTLSKRIKKSVSAILAAAMSLSLFTAIPVSADIGRTTYNYDGYSVDYNVTNEWDGAQTVELTVSNTGTDSILNWALKYDAEGEISNLWNADLYEQNSDEYVIKNVGWNFEIAPNQSVTYGYTLSGNDLPLPKNFEIYSKRVDKTEGYDVQYNITKSWDTGVEGNIVITNTSPAPIEAWTLSFDSNFTVDNLWNGRVLENNGTSYTVAAEMWTNPVQPNGSMTIGFVGSKAADVEALLSNFRLTEVVIGEGMPVIPIDPPAEEFEITANAVYDEENNSIAVSWNTNNPNGTFDILMSEDGKNFVSVGAVEGVPEFVYTPEDFETLYFKVVQTVGELTAESNVSIVVKSSDIIGIIAQAVYDCQDNAINIEWFSDNLNCIFNVYMSYDNSDFICIGTIENESKFIYSVENDFEIIYFKVEQVSNIQNITSNTARVINPIIIDDTTDTDADGLTDAYEKYYFQTDPTNPDTDGDGLPDGYEVLTLGTNPMKSDSDGNGISDSDEDFDKDELSNFEEYQLETDPLNKDTDNDGLSDYDEINKYDTDPLKYDTDNDGISDGDEIALGLDPKNTATNGILDSERTFVQHIGIDSENFVNINTSENPFKVSIDITAAGVAENNIYADKSGYSETIKNDAIIGISPEFTYTDGLKMEDVTINFDIDNSVMENTNGKYTNVSNEFVGIKRFNIFKFFEDTNMLMPIETFHDVENNRVYTYSDELGTYCLMDMEMWFDNIGVEIEKSELQTYSIDSNFEIELMSLNNENTLEDKYVDIALIAYPSAGILDAVKKELINTCDMIFSEAESQNVDVRIYFVSFLGSSMKLNEDTIFATNLDEAKSIINRHRGITAALASKDYILTKAINCVRDELLSDFRKDSDKYCFIIDAFGFPTCNYINGGIDTLKRNNVKVYFSYSANNENYDKYKSLATNSICSEIIVQKGRYNFGDFIFNQIFGEELRFISATDWNELNLNTTLQQNYQLYHNNESYDISLDTDGDGLADYEEIKFETKDGISLVDNNDEENIKLLTYEKIMELLGNKYCCVKGNVKRFYLQDGLKRYRNLRENIDDKIMNMNVLFINSNPEKPDSDSDGIMDCLNNSLEKQGFYIDSADTAPLKKGLANDIVGELYLVSCSSGMGHTYLMFHSYINDTLDFSHLYYIYEQGTWHNITGQKYNVKANEYLTIGNSGDTDEQEDKMIGCLFANFVEGAVATTKITGNIPVGILGGVADAINSPTTGGIHINREIYNTSQRDNFYKDSSAISRKISNSQLHKLIEFSNIRNYYIFAQNNCADVAVGTWNYLYNENFDSTLLLISYPSNIRAELEKSGYITLNADFHLAEYINLNENNGIYDM